MYLFSSWFCESPERRCSWWLSWHLHCSFMRICLLEPERSISIIIVYPPDGILQGLEEWCVRPGFFLFPAEQLAWRKVRVELSGFPMQRFPAEKSKWVSQRWNGRGRSDHLCLLLQMKKDLCPRTPSSHAYVPGRGKTVSVVSPAFSPSHYQRASVFQKEEEGQYLYSLVIDLNHSTLLSQNGIS